jgi:hypothetical protein
VSDVSQSSVILDKELDEEKIVGRPSDTRIRPLCGWSPRKEDTWF